MSEFVINGQVPLRGEIIPSGNKNAVLPMMAACLLTDEPMILRNVPDIRDVQNMKSLLESLGVKFEKIDDGVWKIQANEVHPRELDPDMCRKIRTSILIAGPITSRFGKLILPPPGGDVIGRRRVDTHIFALKALGAEAAYMAEDKVFKFKSKGRLKGATILLDEASVTGTENAIMAAVLAEGETVIRNAASEPHVQELCRMLNKMGAKIRHIGSNILKIEGVEELHGTEFIVGPDYLEVISYVGAAVVTNGSIRIKNAGIEYYDMIRLGFNRIGVDWYYENDDLIVPEKQKMKIVPDLGDAIPKIGVMPWPAFPTDLMSIAIVVATQSSGSILFHDWMYPGRMYFTDKLTGMGAQIVLCDPHRVIVQGPSKLYGEKLDSPDIRAGMALVLAALAAKGESVIRNINQIERGYSAIEQKLKSLGANITRIN
jgi:UDP-N-acetylglucosamine 1-carboxyvinyltransferase